MSTENNYQQYAGTVMERLPQGAFLTTSENGKTNTMTIAWGNIGFMWKKPVFTIMVRQSRYTHQILEKNPVFSVSIPTDDTMKEALGICGSKSGKDTDKITAAKLSLLAGKEIPVPVIDGCGLHFECKIIGRQDLKPGELHEAEDTAWYKEGDYHSLYYGEIITCYPGK